MSLATSCPSCGTVFKVVEDQLKVSEGWVRCGHCHDVFNALEGLFDLERRDSLLQGLRTIPAALDVISPAAADPRTSTDEATDESALTPSESAVSGGAVAVVRSADCSDSGPEHPQQPAPVLQGVTNASRPELSTVRGDLGSIPTRRESDESKWDDDMGDTIIAEDQAPFRHSTSGSEAIPGADYLLQGDLDGTTVTMAPLESPSAEDISPFPPFHPLDATTREELPEFVLDAERRAWWGRPVVRASFAATGVSLLLVLTGQMIIHWRDNLAALCIACRPVVEELVNRVGRTIQPPVQLDAVEVENAVLIHPPGAEGYRLTVQVRNRGNHEVAAPHMELSLTDASGSLLVRRVLSPGDFREPESLAAQAEATWTVEFQTTQKRLSGYAVAAFYP
jgi:predicted Zn finger-like uncharacterized protein